MINRIILFVLFPAPIFFAHQINTLKLLRAKPLIGRDAWAVWSLALCQTEGQDSAIKSQDLGAELVYIPPSIVYFGTWAALQYDPLVLKIASASQMAFSLISLAFPRALCWDRELGAVRPGTRWGQVAVGTRVPAWT